MATDAGPILIRPGRPSDGDAIIGLWDTAIAWMVERGQPGQWGTEPASSRPRTRELVEQWTREPGLRIAEIEQPGRA